MRFPLFLTFNRRPPVPGGNRGRGHLPKRQAEKGMTLVEIAVATALVGLVAATAIATLLSLNKNAVSTQLMTSAREIVQRNIEAAVGAPFTTSNVPDVLKTTVVEGIPWNDAGGSGPVTLYSNRAGLAKIFGNLKRTVAMEANPANADIRRVTFHLDYSLFGRPMSYEMTTLRAVDK